MKLQYLGDAKDAFKWDYHHYLVDALNYAQLRIAWMMTPDDSSNDGNMATELFPAHSEIINLCHHLKLSRNPDDVYKLPELFDAEYQVAFHDKPAADSGQSFFAGIDVINRQVLFLDPDNGFEPEKSYTDKHVRYADIEYLLKKSLASTVITVFQHHRRKKFPEDFARIRQRLHSGYSTAIYWHALMFVCIAKSEKTINRVRRINRRYAKQRPVMVID